MLGDMVVEYYEKMTNGGIWAGNGCLKRRASRVMIDAGINLRMWEQQYRIGGNRDLITDEAGRRRMKKEGIAEMGAKSLNSKKEDLATQEYSYQRRMTP